MRIVHNPYFFRGATPQEGASRLIIGEDDGANVQIVAGLNPGDQVIQDPPDSLIEGEKVTVVNSGANNSKSSGNSGKGGM